MTELPDARLQRLLGDDRLAALRKRLRRHYERAPLDKGVGVIRISKLAPDEHAALASMLGRPQRLSSSMQVDTRVMDDALRRSGISPSLRHALEQIDGPIVHLATARARLELLWSDVVSGCRHPRLIRLLQTAAGPSLLKRLARGRPTTAAQLCRRAETVLQHLPAKGMTRSQLAANALGDAHALDNGQATATLTLAAWRVAEQPSSGQDRYGLEAPADETRGMRGERIRDIWAGAGILVNELARPALFLNLPTLHAENCGHPPGEPAYLSLRTFLRSPPKWDVANRDIFVCENPNLVAIAADHWGRYCAPMVCVDGMPGASQRYLLSQLTGAGARLFYHGDFDWPGIRIGNHVMRMHGAQPWRYSATDYMGGISMPSGHEHPLAGKAVGACWDDKLSAEMQRHGKAIAEEAVAETLLSDLDRK